MPYISLARTFLPWTEMDEDASESFVNFGSRYGSLSWIDLLKHRRVLVLAEAGSGKTIELKERAKLLVAEGKFSFYATVQDVAVDSLDGALSAENRRLLESWSSSDQPAWFFLDSIGGHKARDMFVRDLKLGSGIKVPTRDFR